MDASPAADSFEQFRSGRSHIRLLMPVREVEVKQLLAIVEWGQNREM
jgi:hypothetical protein